VLQAEPELQKKLLKV
jgi:hypothetical protein